MSTDILPVAGRYMLPGDYPEVARLEHGSENSWTRQDYCNVTKDMRASPYVFEAGQRLKNIVGLVLIETQPDHLRILRLLVERENWRRKIGTQILNYVNQRLWSKNKKEAFVYVREDNLAAQLFLRSYGYRAVHLERGRDGELDEYLFRCERCYSKTITGGHLATAGL